ncbi:MAG: nitroreductase family protein [Ichthyobacteriaceae bacterium]|nr:nitroreductase family protein [Ichthyobacteriaceae bacterium]
MDFIDIIENRRSVRKFTDKKIDDEVLKKLLQPLEFTPSSKSKYPLKFVVIRNDNMLHKLSESKDSGANFLNNSALAIVILADELKSDVWIEDASIASSYLMLSAVNNNLASTWVQIRNRNIKDQSSEHYVKKLLNIPDNFRVECILGMGYPLTETQPEKGKSFNMLDIYFEQL